MRRIGSTASGACAILRGMATNGGTGTNVLYIMLGGLAAGLAGTITAIAIEIWRGFSSRPRLRLDPRVISGGADITDAVFIGEPGFQVGDTLEIRLVNPTPRTIVITSAGFTFARPFHMWSLLRRSMEKRIAVGRLKNWWHFRWGLGERMLRPVFDVVRTADMPIIARPDDVPVVTQTLSSLEYRCHLMQKSMSDVEAVWVETSEGKRFEQPLASNVRRALRKLETPTP